MSYTLNHPSKVYVKDSPVHGYGVFASEKINKGEVIEECYVIKIPVKRGFLPQLFIDYKFKWINENQEVEEVLPLGFGCVYNHSDEYNATWKQNTYRKTIEFIAVRDIEIGEEIFHKYGDENYWITKSKIKSLST